jgi:hypothetical protein
LQACTRWELLLLLLLLWGLLCMQLLQGLLMGGSM